MRVALAAAWFIAMNATPVAAQTNPLAISPLRDRPEGPVPVLRQRHPPGTQPCGVEVRWLAGGVMRTRHALGPVPGLVSLEHGALAASDRVDVHYRGTAIASAGGPQAGSTSFAWRPRGDDTTIEITVSGSGDRPRAYRLSCPH